MDSKEDRTCQASHEEICDNALSHYEQLSSECHDWLSTVPKAIKFYKKYRKVLERCGDVEGIIEMLYPFVLPFAPDDKEVGRLAKAINEYLLNEK